MKKKVRPFSKNIRPFFNEASRNFYKALTFFATKFEVVKREFAQKDLSYHEYPKNDFGRDLCVFTCELAHSALQVAMA